MLLGSIIGVSIILSTVLILVFRQKQSFEISDEQNIMGLDDLMVLFSIGIENI